MTSPRLPKTGAELFWPGARRNEVSVETPAQKRARTFHQLMQPDAGGVREFEQFEFDPEQLPPELTSQYMEGPLGDIAGPFVPKGASAGQLWEPGLTGFMGGEESAARVPWETIEQFPPGLYEEYVGQYGPEPWAGLRPSPYEDVTAAQLSQREFEWSLLSLDEKSKATIARAGQGMFAPGDLSIPPFMPGIEPKPQFGTKDDLIDPERAMAALMKGLEAVTRPLDAFAEAAWQTLSSDLEKGEFDAAFFDLVTNPEKFVDAESEYIKAFRERPLLQQFALGILDPTVLIGPARAGSKLATALLRTILQREAGQFAGRFAVGSVDDFIRVMRQTPRTYGGAWPSAAGDTGFGLPAEVAQQRAVRAPLGPPGRGPHPDILYPRQGVQAPPVDATWEQWARPGTPGPTGPSPMTAARPSMDDFLEAYDPFYPSEPIVPRPLRLYRQDLEAKLTTVRTRIADVETRKGPRMAGAARKTLLNTLRNEQQILEDQLSKLDISPAPVDVVESMRYQNYRQLDVLPDNQQQVIVVSMAHPGGRRLTLTLNRDARRLLTELGQIGPEDADYIILERSATRRQVRDATTSLTNRWAQEGRGIGLTAEESWQVFSEPDIPARLIIRDEPAFPVSNLSADESRGLLSQYLADFPHEVQNLDDLGRQLPTERVIEGTVRLERISPPTHMPEYFEGYDIFGVIEDTVDGPETVAVIEMLKPKSGSLGQIIHFYPTATGGGPGMLRGEPMKKVLSDLAAFYPHLHDIEIAGQPIYHRGRVIGPGNFDDAAFPLIGNKTVTDDIANGVSDVAPSPSSTDADLGPRTTDGAPSRTDSPQELGPLTGAELYDQAQLGMLTDVERTGMKHPDETPDLANPFYVMKAWLSHDILFGPESRAKWLRGRPGTRIAGVGRQLAGLWSRVAVERDNPIAMAGHSNQLHKDVEFARIKSIVTAWWKQTQDAFGFREQDLTLVQRAAGTTRGTWRATKVQFTDGGNLATKVKNYRLTGTLDDILEDIDRVKEGHAPIYTLTFNQQRLLDAGQNMQEQLLLVARDAGVDVVGIEEAYWHRILYKNKGWDVDDLVRGQFQGTKMGYTNRRGILHMNQADKLGLVYETNPSLRLIARLQAGVETIANTHTRTRILNLTDIELGLPNATGKKIFRTPASRKRLLSGHPEVLASLKETNAIRKEAVKAYKAHIKATELPNAVIGYDPDFLFALRKAEADYVTALHKALMTGQMVTGITRAGLKEALILGKAGTEDVVKSVLDLVHIPEVQNSRQPGVFGGVGLRRMRETSQLARSLMTNVDLAVSFIQGNNIFFYKPRVWLQATMESWAAFVREPQAFYEKNWVVMDEGMNNAAIMRPTEYLFEQTGIASYPTKIPFLGNVLTRFNRAFEWYIVAAQTEMYKVARKNIVAPADKPFGAFINNQESIDALVDLGKSIRRTLGTENYAILGIRPDQQTIESLTLFAARFFRANIGLIAMGLNPLDTSKGAWQARKALGSLMAAGLGITTAIHYAKTGRPPNVTDPYKVDWLQFPVGKGYMNVFGPFYSYMRTVARMGASFEQLEGWKALDEGSKFLESRAGLLFRTMGITVESLANPDGARTFEGEKIDFTVTGVLAAASETVIPIAPMEVFKGINDGRWEVTAEIMGLNTRASAYQQMDLLYQNYLQEPTHDMVLMREAVRAKEDDYPISTSRRDLSWQEGLAQIVPDLLSGDILGRAHGPSWADAMPAEREWMEDEHPELYAEAIKSRPGDYGDASREIWDHHKTLMEKERLLNKALYNPEEAANGNEVDGAEYRRRFDGFRLEKWILRQDVNERYDLFQDTENPEDEKDINKRAMMEYHQVYKRNTRGDGSMNWVEVEHEMDALVASWTQAQNSYININTSRWHTDKGDELIRDKRALRELWDLRDVWITDFSDTPEIQAEYERMYKEYSNASETYKNQMSQLPSYRNMLRVLSIRENQWIEDHNTKEHGYKGGALEVLKVKWGYETDPITPQGIELLEEHNELMGNLDVPRLPPILPSSPPVPTTGSTTPFWGGQDETQDTNPFREPQMQGVGATGNRFWQTQ